MSDDTALREAIVRVRMGLVDHATACFLADAAERSLTLKQEKDEACDLAQWFEHEVAQLTNENAQLRANKERLDAGIADLSVTLREAIDAVRSSPEHI